MKELSITPGIGGGACKSSSQQKLIAALSSLNRDAMIQETPAFRRE